VIGFDHEYIDLVIGSWEMLDNALGQYAYRMIIKEARYKAYSNWTTMAADIRQGGGSTSGGPPFIIYHHVFLPGSEHPPVTATTPTAITAIVVEHCQMTLQNDVFLTEKPSRQQCWAIQRVHSMEFGLECDIILSMETKVEP